MCCNLSIFVNDFFSNNSWFFGMPMRTSSNCVIKITKYLILIHYILYLIVGRLMTKNVHETWVMPNGRLEPLCVCVEESVSQGRSYVNSNANISNCFFIRTSQLSGNGGVININGGSYHLDIVFSIFYGCSCQSEGGAICFNSLFCKMKAICASRCIASAEHFAYISSSTNISLNLLSITACCYVTNGNYPLFIYLSHQSYENSNSSMNHASQTSGICIHSPLSFLSIYCTVSNNNAYNGICINTNANTGIMKYANIVHNNSPLKYGVFYNSGSFALQNCIINQNRNTLFYMNSGSITVTNSFVSHLGVTMTQNNNTNTIIPTYILQYYKTANCHADQEYSEISIQYTCLGFHARINFHMLLFLLPTQIL